MTGNVWEWVEGGLPETLAALGGSYDDPAKVEGIAFANVTRAPKRLTRATIGFRPVMSVDGRSSPASRIVKGYEFVSVAGGEFVSGCPSSMRSSVESLATSHGYRSDFADRSAAARAHLDDYLIGRCAVSNDDYRNFVEATGHRRPSHWGSETPYSPQLARHPVVNISVTDALAFCRWLDPAANLPNLMQWEKAARGIDGRLYPWGNDFRAGLTNGAESGVKRTVPVDAYPEGASPCGALNMAGNVGEWVIDRATVRGGSFRSSCQLYGLTFFTLEADMALCDDDLGFRCAYDATTEL
jgi:formylglycine-generating enzyme required for sulfatase activity